MSYELYTHPYVFRTVYSDGGRPVVPRVRLGFCVPCLRAWDCKAPVRKPCVKKMYGSAMETGTPPLFQPCICVTIVISQPRMRSDIGTMTAGPVSTTRQSIRVRADIIGHARIKM